MVSLDGLQHPIKSMRQESTGKEPALNAATYRHSRQNDYCNRVGHVAPKVALRGDHYKEARGLRHASLYSSCINELFGDD